MRSKSSRAADSSVQVTNLSHNALMCARELHIIKASELTELTSATPDASPNRVANSKMWASEDRPDSILPMTSYNKISYQLIAQVEALC